MSENSDSYRGLTLFFFDTETSWLNEDSQIIEFWWIFASFDPDTWELEERTTRYISHYINCTVDIEEDAYEVHHISKELLNKYQYIDYYIDEIMWCFSHADMVIWHNVEFDIKMMEKECRRINYDFDRWKLTCFDTMKQTAQLLQIPSPSGLWYKWPKLSELYRFLFGSDFSNAHDAMADIKATKDCFMKLLEIWYVQIPVHHKFTVKEEDLDDWVPPMVIDTLACSVCGKYFDLKDFHISNWEKRRIFLCKECYNQLKNDFPS